MNFQNKSVTSAVLRLRYRLVSPADYWVQSRQRIFLATAHLTWSCGVCFSLKQEEALKAEETVRRATQRHGTIRILSRPNPSNSTHLQLNLEIILSIWRPTVHAEKEGQKSIFAWAWPSLCGLCLRPVYLWSTPFVSSMKSDSWPKVRDFTLILNWALGID